MASVFQSSQCRSPKRFGSLAAASYKIEEVPARIGLILHNVKLATGEINTDQIDAETMRVAIANWFMVEAERIYGIMAGEAASQFERELVDWIRRKGGSVSAAELAKGSRKYPSSEEAEEHLNLLVDMGWGFWMSGNPGQSGGRPTRRFTLVPVGDPPTKPEESDGFDDIRHGSQQKTDNVSKLEDEVTSDQVEPASGETVPDEEVEVLF